MTDLDAKASCIGCGAILAVDEPEGGQSLYGTLAERMARHEATCRHNRGQEDWYLPWPDDEQEHEPHSVEYVRRLTGRLVY